MITSSTQKIDLQYRGRAISISTTPTRSGWSWAAFIDSRPAIKCELAALTSAEIALESGRLAVEDVIDAGDDYSTRTSSPSRVA